MAATMATNEDTSLPRCWLKEVTSLERSAMPICLPPLPSVGWTVPGGELKFRTHLSGGRQQRPCRLSRQGWYVAGAVLSPFPPATQRQEHVDLSVGNRGVGSGECRLGSRKARIGTQDIEDARSAEAEQSAGL